MAEDQAGAGAGERLRELRDATLQVDPARAGDGAVHAEPLGVFGAKLARNGVEERFVDDTIAAQDADVGDRAAAVQGGGAAGQIDLAGVGEGARYVKNAAID